MGHCPDLVPTVAVLAAFAQGPTRVRNVAHLRIKESDRITAPATELARLGVRVDEHDDGLTVHGLGPDGPAWDEAARFSAHNDHRIAMSLALLGCPTASAWTPCWTIRWWCASPSPTFWKTSTTAPWARVQNMNFITNLAYFAPGWQGRKTCCPTSPSFRRRLHAAEKMLTEDGTMFTGLFEANPYSHEAVRQYRKMPNAAAAGDIELLCRRAQWWWKK